MNVTCVVLTRDSEYDGTTLKKHFSEVLVLVDSQKEVPKNNDGVTYIHHPLAHDFALHRNVALKHASYEWTLFLDDDESLSEELIQEIQKAVTTDNDGFFIRRRDMFMGQELHHGETARARFLRLGRTKGGSWERPVHETWNIRGKIGELKHFLRHNPHVSIEAFLEKISWYTAIEARHRKKQRQRASTFQLLLYPFAKFIRNYVLSLGFLDGFPGLAMAYMMSLHSLIVRVRMYETQQV